MTDQPTVHLDVCTPEGKTWCAILHGTGGQYGLERSFVGAIERNLSKSGRTGTMTYELPDGVIETNEGRRRLGRTYYLVHAGVATEIDLTTARRYLNDTDALAAAKADVEAAIAAAGHPDSEHVEAS